MTRKSKRRSSVVEIGTGPARVRIYTINRKDGYTEFTLAWKEGGRRQDPQPLLHGRGPDGRPANHRPTHQRLA